MGCQDAGVPRRGGGVPPKRTSSKGMPRLVRAIFSTSASSCRDCHAYVQRVSTENRKSENREPRTENREPRAENRKQKTENTPTNTWRCLRRVGQSIAGSGRRLCICFKYGGCCFTLLHAQVSARGRLATDRCLVRTHEPLPVRLVGSAALSEHQRWVVPSSGRGRATRIAARA